MPYPMETTLENHLIQQSSKIIEISQTHLQLMQHEQDFYVTVILQCVCVCAHARVKSKTETIIDSLNEQ